MIETVFTLEDENETMPETPGTDMPGEGGTEEGGDGMPAGFLGDEEGESMDAPEGQMDDGEEEGGNEE